MKHTPIARFIAAAVLAGSALGFASAAQARTDVRVSIGLPGLPILVHAGPAPVFVQSRPVYVRPRPFYGPPAVVYQRPWHPAYRYRFDRDRPSQRGGWQHREWDSHHPDRDRPAPRDRQQRH